MNVATTGGETKAVGCSDLTHTQAVPLWDECKIPSVIKCLHLTNSRLIAHQCLINSSLLPLVLLSSRGLTAESHDLDQISIMLSPVQANKAGTVARGKDGSLKPKMVYLHVTMILWKSNWEISGVRVAASSWGWHWRNVRMTISTFVNANAVISSYSWNVLWFSGGRWLDDSGHLRALWTSS